MPKEKTDREFIVQDTKRAWGYLEQYISRMKQVHDRIGIEYPDVQQAAKLMSNVAVELQKTTESFLTAYKTI